MSPVTTSYKPLSEAIEIMLTFILYRGHPNYEETLAWSHLITDLYSTFKKQDYTFKDLHLLHQYFLAQNIELIFRKYPSLSPVIA
jgi:hypothetical protein